MFSNNHNIYSGSVVKTKKSGKVNEPDITPKYLAVREIFKKYSDKELPQVPSNRRKKAYGKVTLTEFADLFDNLHLISKPIHSEVPKCMEEYGQGYGYIAYRTKLNRDYENSKITFESLGDRAQIFVNKVFCGIAYINENLSVEFSAKKGDVLTVLCENMGRTNFGPKMMRKKGIAGRCLIDGKIHFNWDAYPLNMEDLNLLNFEKVKKSDNLIFCKSLFNIDEIADTFLLLENFRKGFVLINGFNIGRYWEIGPQKTLYVPKDLLNSKNNEIVIFESDGIKGNPQVEFFDSPIL